MYMMGAKAMWGLPLSLLKFSHVNSEIFQKLKSTFKGKKENKN